jgi:serine/threonine protein kinase
VVSTSFLKFGKRRVNQYVIEKLLGKGSFSKVYLCTDKKSKTKYALKEMDKSELSLRKSSNGKFCIDFVIEELKIC